MKRITASLAAIGLLAGTAALADYPEKPITIVVPYGAGGGSDIMVRTVAPYIEKYLGDDAKIVVENRTGASGIIGWQAVHDAKPDGYTIGVITTPSIVTKPIEGKAEFTWQDFTIIANMVTDPAALNVKKGSQFEDVTGLVDYARENPKVVTMATGNFGGDDCAPPWPDLRPPRKDPPHELRLFGRPREPSAECRIRRRVQRYPGAGRQ